MADWVDSYYEGVEYFEAEDGTYKGVAWMDGDEERVYMDMEVQLPRPLRFVPHVVLGELDDG